MLMNDLIWIIIIVVVAGAILFASWLACSMTKRNLYKIECDE